MGVYGKTKIKLYKGNTKIKKAYLGKTQIYSAGNYVTYYVDTDTYYDEEVESDASVLSPTSFTPTKSGWTFVGWREDTTASGTVLSSKVMADEPITLYAIYSKDVTRTFYSGTAKATVKALTSPMYYNASGNTLGASFTPPTPTTISGWTWRGWGGNGSTSATASVNTNLNSTFTASTDGTHYGLYEQTVTQTFKSYGSPQTVDGTRYYNSAGNTENASVTAPTGVTYENYTWRGWAAAGVTTADADVAYANGDTISNITSANTYYGLHGRTITLHYNGNGSTSGSMSSQSGTRYYNTSGEYLNPTFVLASNGFTKTDYTFSKWAMGSTSGTQYAVGASVTLDSITTFYAIWTVTAKTIYSGTWNVSKNTSNYLSSTFDLTAYSKIAVTVSYNPISTWNSNEAYYSFGVDTDTSDDMVAENKFHTFTYWSSSNNHDSSGSGTYSLDISSLSGKHYVRFVNTGQEHQSDCEQYNCHGLNSSFTVTKVVLS